MEITRPIPPFTQPPTHASRAWAYVLVAILVILAALAAWYFFAGTVPTPAETPSAVESASLPPLSSGDSDADIQADINQLPDDSAAMVQDQQSLDQSIQGI